MIRATLFLVFAGASSCALAGGDMAPLTGTPPVEPIAQLEQEAASIAGKLGQRLRDELQSAMSAGGPQKAIAVCHEKALPLTAEIAAQSGWDVGRTALRLRNPANAPDAWELAVLEDFQRRHAAGADATALAAATIVNDGNTRQFRYMKAITTAPACTLCHGAAIPPELAEAIRARYPSDQATGFTAGDLRGAFSLTKNLD
jgi:hypothetical protein